MLHSTAQHSTAQHSTAQHSTAQHSTAQHSLIPSANKNSIYLIKSIFIRKAIFRLIFLRNISASFLCYFINYCLIQYFNIGWVLMSANMNKEKII
jgi:hypothetical protein